MAQLNTKQVYVRCPVSVWSRNILLFIMKEKEKRKTTQIKCLQSMFTMKCLHKLFTIVFNNFLHNTTRTSHIRCITAKSKWLWHNVLWLVFRVLWLVLWSRWLTRSYRWCWWFIHIRGMRWRRYSRMRTFDGDVCLDWWGRWNFIISISDSWCSA